jgi:hypothetical protein
MASDAALVFAVVSVVVGTFAILLNGSILTILLKRRRHVFSHVFYVLIFNFALIDVLKGPNLLKSLVFSNMNHYSASQ